MLDNLEENIQPKWLAPIGLLGQPNLKDATEGLCFK